jgi:ABC-type nitrate/sulfonate/bicarbonate transport system permease component
MEVIWNVIFQQVLPRIIESVRLHIGPAMVFLIAAEWAVADVGFGYQLKILSRMTRMNVVYLYLLILGASGLLIDGCLSLTRRKLSPWFGE